MAPLSPYQMFLFCRPSVVSTVPSPPFNKSSTIIDFSWRIIDHRVFTSKNAKGKVDILGLIGTIIDDCPAKCKIYILGLIGIWLLTSSTHVSNLPSPSIIFAT